MSDSTQAIERAKKAVLELQATSRERDQQTLEHLNGDDVSEIREAARQAKDLPKNYESNREALTLYRDALRDAQKDAAHQRLAGNHEAAGPTVQAFDSQIAKASVAIQAANLSLHHQKAALQKSAGRTEIGVGK
ncbi:hypothetical protein ACLPHM_02745 [Paenalcaligenes sp. Me131]|uniref:hypothetical protein n=1 Tax=Paenalcaligenes sp. Me131 TaxID=3392636 RepID=UPI003D2E75AB